MILKMLTIKQRSRIIELYLAHNLHWTKYKFDKLRNIASNENIIASKLSIRKTIIKWMLYRTVGIIPSINRDIKNTKVSENELYRLERKVFKYRQLSASKLRSKTRIRASVRSVQKYLNLLGFYYYLIFFVRSSSKVGLF